MTSPTHGLRGRGAPHLPWLAVAVLVLLLALLAGLQVRWLGQVAAAERQRLAAAAEDALAGLAHELDTELSRAWLIFRRVGDEPDPRSAVRALREVWLESAPYPELIAAWVLLRPGSLERAEVLTRDAADWAPVGDELARRLGVAPGGAPGADHRLHHAPPEAIGRGLLRPELPGLVVPIDGGRRRSPPGEPRQRGPQGLLVVVFDREALAENLLPRLVARHAGRIAGRELEVRVRSATSGEIVYASAPDLAGTFEWQAPLFDLLPAEQLGRLGVSIGAFGRAPERWRDRFEEGGRRGRRAELAALFVRRPGWLLEARPAAGSLDAAVARARRGNAVLGFGILVLLALAAAALLVSTRRAQEMASRQLEFTAAVSHELRTPLAAIRSLGDNLAHGVVRDLDQARLYGEQISGQSARLGSLVEQVLALSAHRLVPLDRRPIDLAEVVREAVAEESAATGASAVALELPAGDPALVSGDPTALRRAVGNLVANAAKHGRPPIAVRLVPAAGELRIEVADRGPGIPAAERERLFEPFFRGRRAQGEQIPGVGLGLHLVRRLVESHGGRVEVASGEGGSVFTIVLPREERA